MSGPALPGRGQVFRPGLEGRWGTWGGPWKLLQIQIQDPSRKALASGPCPSWTEERTKTLAVMRGKVGRSQGPSFARVAR